MSTECIELMTIYVGDLPVSYVTKQNRKLADSFSSGEFSPEGLWSHFPPPDAGRFLVQGAGRQTFLFKVFDCSCFYFFILKCFKIIWHSGRSDSFIEIYILKLVPEILKFFLTVDHPLSLCLKTLLSNCWYLRNLISLYHSDLLF